MLETTRAYSVVLEVQNLDCFGLLDQVSDLHGTAVTKTVVCEVENLQVLVALQELLEEANILNL